MQEGKAPAKPPRGHRRLDASCWQQRTGGQEGDAKRGWEHFFSFVAMFFSKNQGERQCRKSSEEVGKTFIVSKFEGKKKRRYEMKTDLIYLLASCHV